MVKRPLAERPEPTPTSSSGRTPHGPGSRGLPGEYGLKKHDVLTVAQAAGTLTHDVRTSMGTGRPS